MEIIKLMPNRRTGGESAIFEHNGEYFYADKSYILFCGEETMIFPCNKDGEVLDWMELYCNRGEKSLEDCIKEFCETYTPEPHNEDSHEEITPSHKYYIVFNEWCYPTESGRKYIGNYDTRAEAEAVVTIQGIDEWDNFLKINGNIYREASGTYNNIDGTIAGYMIHSSSNEEEDMYFRSYIIEVEAWK